MSKSDNLQIGDTGQKDLLKVILQPIETPEQEKTVQEAAELLNKLNEQK